MVDTEKNPDVLDITAQIGNLTLKGMPNMKFKYGKNFTLFCKRFKEAITLTKFEDPNLYLIFLRCMDDRTYTLLENQISNLEEGDKKDPELFCKKYEQIYYPEGESSSAKAQLLGIKQLSNENIDDYSFRLTELGNRAYDNEIMKNDSCLTAFLNGILETSLKVKCNEQNFNTFLEAINYARKIERIHENIKSPKIGFSQTSRSKSPAPYQHNNAHPSEENNSGLRNKNQNEP